MPCPPYTATSNSFEAQNNVNIVNNVTVNKTEHHKISLVGSLGNPYVCMTINKVPIKGMIDTGAGRSCITTTAVKKYLGRKALKQLVSVDLKLTAANGEPLRVLGQLETQLKIGSTQIKHPLIVFQNKKCEFLIGNDVLIDKFNVVKSRYISPANNVNEKIPIQYVNKSLPVNNIKAVEIPPQTIIEINVVAPLKDRDVIIGCDVEVEGVDDNHLGISIEPVVTTPDTKGKIRCLVVNNSSEFATIPADTKIAQINLIHDECHSINSINTIENININSAEFSQDAEAEKELLEGNKEGTLPDPPGYDGTSFDQYNPVEVAKLDHLDDKQRKQVLDLIRKFPTAFAKSDADIGTTDIMTHKIDVTGVTPIADPYRPVPVKYEKDVEDKINELLKLGVITEAKQSPWASNLVIVKKKESGKLRICCDLRGPNSVSKHKNKWPIRSIESSFAKLANAKYVTSLDLLSAYWTIKMDEESSKVTAFYGPNAKHYQWLRMPFGLAAAPHTYCQVMSKVVHGLDEYCFFYFDDIIIFSQTFEDHLKHLGVVIDRFNKAGFKINAKKCNFLCTESMPIEWLGSIIKHGKIFTDQKKIEAIQQITPPKSVKELQAFIGAVGFHRRHIPYLSDLINPLIELTKTKRGEDFIWTNEHQKSFDDTKKALCSSDGLALPDVNKPFILTSDSSHIALGVCLSQINDKGEEKVCAYGSRKFKEIEQRNMSIPEKELAGILYGLKLFAYYLRNNHFTIKTDARSLVFLKRFKTCNSKIARTAIWLQDFDFDIVHLSKRTGNTMAIADCLSRAHESQFKLEGYKALKDPKLNDWPDIDVPDYCSYEDFDAIADKFLKENPITGNVNWISEEPDYPSPLYMPPVLVPETVDQIASKEHRILHVSLTDACMTAKDFAFIQGEDPELVKQIKLAKTDEASDFKLCQGVLTKIVDGDTRVVVPASFRTELIKWHHGSFWANHVGSKKLYASLARFYYWPNMFKDIKDTIRECKICQYVKPDTTGGIGLGKSKTPTKPNQLVAFDVVTGLPRTNSGHCCILVIVDDFTKFCTAVEMKDKTAESVARVFMSHWIRFFGPPKQLHSDEGTEVDSSLMQNISAILGIRKTHTPIYNPKSDGTVERLNQAIGNMIQAYVTEYNKNKWHHLLPFMVSGYNNIVHTATGYSPAELLFGQDTAYNIVPVVNIENEILDKSEYLTALRTGQEIKWQIVSKRLDHLKELRIRNSTDRRNPYKIGDFVLLKDLTPKVAKTAADKGTKHYHRWKGPYRILHIYPNALVIVHWEKDLPKDENTFSHQGEFIKRHISLVSPNQVKLFHGKVEREPIINDDIINTFLSDLGIKDKSQPIVERSEKSRYNLRDLSSKDENNVNVIRFRNRKRKSYSKLIIPIDSDDSSSDEDDEPCQKKVINKRYRQQEGLNPWATSPINHRLSQYRSNNYNSPTPYSYDENQGESTPKRENPLRLDDEPSDKGITTRHMDLFYSLNRDQTKATVENPISPNDLQDEGEREVAEEMDDDMPALSAEDDDVLTSDNIKSENTQNIESPKNISEDVVEDEEVSNAAKIDTPVPVTTTPISTKNTGAVQQNFSY